MEKITDIGQIVALCQTMTNLKLDIVCGADRLFAQRWYEERYLTGQHTRYVMKPGLFINSIEDGRVYRAFNTSDEKAAEFMEAAEEYKDYFIDLQAEAVTIPETGDDPELTEEEIAAAKRSEAAKKAAATRAAKKAEAEAGAAEGLKEFEE